MKEQFWPNQGDLTNQAQNPYSGGGEGFMDQGQQEQSSRAGTATAEGSGAQRVGATFERPRRQLTPEETREYWGRFEHSRGGLTDQQKARRDETVSGRMILEVEINEQGEFQIPGVDAQDITDSEVLSAIRFINYLHDYGGVDMDEALKRIKDLMGLRSQAEEQLRQSGLDPLQQQLQQRRIGETNLALQRIGGYLNEENRKQREIQEAKEDARMARYFTRKEEEAIKTDPLERARIFEEIFIGVDANPGVQFLQALSLEQRYKYDIFLKILSEAAVDTVEREKLTQEFAGRYEVRRILHDANWSVSEGGGDIQAFVSTMATFKAEYVDLIFEDPLVETALHMFEQAFQKIKADNNGILPYEKLAWDYKRRTSDLETMVWDRLQEAVQKGVVRDKGQPIQLGDKEEWRLRRAIILARGFGVASLRFPEIAAEARLPEETATSDALTKSKRLVSIYGEAIARYLDPLEHLIEKFSIGDEDRAFLYFFLAGEKGHFQSKAQLEKALEAKSKFTKEDKRLIDLVNIFRIGGPFTVSSWRAFVTMQKGEGETEQEYKERLRRSGVGIRETRVGGDVDDEISKEVREDPRFKGKSGEEIEKDEKLKAEFEEEVKRRKGEKVSDPNNTAGKEISYEDKLKLDKRLQMWKDVLKVNPLRVMWMWEKKEPGKRLAFLQEALEKLGVPKNQAKDQGGKWLDEVEKDLMVIQEKTVSSRKDIQERGEMLDFSIIKDGERQDRVRKYVEIIRQKAEENNYQFFRELFTTDYGEKKYPFPFLIGMEEIPFSELNFINTGGRGMLRRINDYAGAVQAANELTELITSIPTTHNIGPLIERLNKIKQAVSIYDRSIAMEVLPLLAEGIIRVYDKDVLARLPLGMGTIYGLFHDTSYAQVAYGREATTWDETDKFNFTRQLLQNGLIKKEKLEELRRRVGATYANLLIDLFRTYGQLVLLFLVFEFMKTTFAEKK